MTALTDAIRAHFVACIDAGQFDGDRLDALLAEVEALQSRAAAQPTRPRNTGGLTGALLAEPLPRSFGVVVGGSERPTLEILKGNADLVQPEHDAHVRAMEAREAARRG